MRTRYQELLEELAEIKKFAQMYGVDLEQAGGGTRRRETGAAAPRARRGKGRFAKTPVREAVRTVLDEAGGPLHLTEILEAITAEGARLGGKNPKNTLSGTIMGDKRLTRVAPNTFDLTARVK
jgi:hypothetical protein